MAINTLTLYPDVAQSLDDVMPQIAALKPMFDDRGFLAVELGWKGLLSNQLIGHAAFMDADLLVVPLVFGYLERARGAAGRNVSYTGRPVRAEDQHRGALRAVGEFAQLLGLPVVLASGPDPRS